jgi:hypothetical protein
VSWDTGVASRGPQGQGYFILMVRCICLSNSNSLKSVQWDFSESYSI